MGYHWIIFIKKMCAYLFIDLSSYFLNLHKKTSLWFKFYDIGHDCMHIYFFPILFFKFFCVLTNYIGRVSRYKTLRTEPVEQKSRRESSKIKYSSIHEYGRNYQCPNHYSKRAEKRQKYIFIFLNTRLRGCACLFCLL